MMLSLIVCIFAMLVVLQAQRKLLRVTSVHCMNEDPVSRCFWKPCSPTDSGHKTFWMRQIALTLVHYLASDWRRLFKSLDGKVDWAQVGGDRTHFRKALVELAAMNRAERRPVCEVAGGLGSAVTPRPLGCRAKQQPQT